MLGNEHDADDAFQATFLVLIRKANLLRSAGLIGNWLYGVAYRTSLHARQVAAKRRAKEAKVLPYAEKATDRLADVWPVLDQELERLPDKYRAVVLLCDLEGKTRHQAALHFGWAEGTVASRLARGRVLLAKRLARRGVVLSAGALAVVLSQQAVPACVPNALASATSKTATLLATGQTAAEGVLGPKVVSLTEGVVRTMLLTKCKVTMAGAVMLLASIMAVYGLGVLSPAEAKQVPFPGGPNQQVRVDEKRNRREGGATARGASSAPETHRSRPQGQFTGRLGARQGDTIAVTFAVDDASSSVTNVYCASTKSKEQAAHSTWHSSTRMRSHMRAN